MKVVKTWFKKREGVFFFRATSLFLCTYPFLGPVFGYQGRSKNFSEILRAVIDASTWCGSNVIILLRIYKVFRQTRKIC